MVEVWLPLPRNWPQLPACPPACSPGWLEKWIFISPAHRAPTKSVWLAAFPPPVPRISPAQQNVTEPAIYEKRELIVRFTFLLLFIYLLCTGGEAWPHLEPGPQPPTLPTNTHHPPPANLLLNCTRTRTALCFYFCLRKLFSANCGQINEQ